MIFGGGRSGLLVAYPRTVAGSAIRRDNFIEERNMRGSLGASIILNSAAVSTKMHLMYTLDEAGNRIYTLKVRSPSPIIECLSDFQRILTGQKIVESGKITKSAHPG